MSRCYSSKSREQDGIVGKGRGPIRLKGRGRQSVTCLRYHSSLSHNDLSIIEPALSTLAVFFQNNPQFRYGCLGGSGEGEGCEQIGEIYFIKSRRGCGVIHLVPREHYCVVAFLPLPPPLPRSAGTVANTHTRDLSFR